MSEAFDRKAALRAYKERKPRPGIYAVRRIETGESWPGSSLNLDTTRNGLWIQLNQGRHLDKALQEAWRTYGEAAFDYVILEIIEEELSPFVLKETLKAKVAEWRRMLKEEACRGIGLSGR
ncbi:GIY-YIG nuclease family protein [Geothrix sp. 21YS21S-4]|uniref:GIY-YIG nuclease family protein n=1 Tax=Geothrix sp. 21YS21S-4 TaxID=3068889 RepID=UPI0027B99638|nr:GIY-YIG nuclease family protein [Geothrix sp. 21YS21S-4]